jgi:hypothetical protein
LLIGELGAGASTLLVRLLLDGTAALEGDQWVVISGTSVAAVPELISLNDGWEELLPELSGAEMRESRDAWDWRSWALDPRQVGRDWRLQDGPVTSLFVLERQHGSRSRIRPTSTVMALEALLAAAEDTGPGVVAAAASVLRGASLYRLSVGDLAGAAAAVAEAVSA